MKFKSQKNGLKADEEDDDDEDMRSSYLPGGHLTQKPRGRDEAPGAEGRSRSRSRSISKAFKKLVRGGASKQNLAPGDAVDDDASAASNMSTASKRKPKFGKAVSKAAVKAAAAPEAEEEEEEEESLAGNDDISKASKKPKSKKSLKSKKSKSSDDDGAAKSPSSMSPVPVPTSIRLTEENPDDDGLKKKKKKKTKKSKSDDEHSIGSFDFSLTDSEGFLTPPTKSRKKKKPIKKGEISAPNLDDDDASRSSKRSSKKKSSSSKKLRNKSSSSNLHDSNPSIDEELDLDDDDETASLKSGKSSGKRAPRRSRETSRSSDKKPPRTNSCGGLKDLVEEKKSGKAPRRQSLGSLKDRGERVKSRPRRKKSPPPADYKDRKDQISKWKQLRDASRTDLGENFEAPKLDDVMKHLDGDVPHDTEVQKRRSVMVNQLKDTMSFRHIWDVCGGSDKDSVTEGSEDIYVDDDAVPAKSLPSLAESANSLGSEEKSEAEEEKTAPAEVPKPEVSEPPEPAPREPDNESSSYEEDSASADSEKAQPPKADSQKITPGNVDPEKPDAEKADPEKKDPDESDTDHEEAPEDKVVEETKDASSDSEIVIADVAERRSSAVEPSRCHSLPTPPVSPVKAKLEGNDFVKQLTMALNKVAKLNEELRKVEGEAAQAKGELGEMKFQMNIVITEKKDMEQTLAKMKEDAAAKDERIEKLEVVVETQLDRVEFLEEKLVQTEDELFKMEDEVKELEAKQGLPSESAHGQMRLQRMSSIRQDRMVRMDSHRVIQADSRRISGKELSESTHASKNNDVYLTTWERDLDKREQGMDAEKAEMDLRELRLREREQELEDREKNVRKAPNGTSSGETFSDDKDQEIAALREECAELIAEKKELVRLHKEKTDSREEEFLQIEDEMQLKLNDLEEENHILRNKLEGLEENAAKAQKYKTTISVLEAEIFALKKPKGGSEEKEDEETVQKLQSEIMQQLAELDEENQRLNEKMATEEKKFKHILMDKDEAILDLEDMLDELNKILESGDGEGHAMSMAKELSELKKKSRDIAKLEDERDDAIADLRSKNLYVEELEREIRELKEKTSENRKSESSLVSQARVKQLEDELEATKAVIEAKTSDAYSMRLKEEIKTLKESYNQLKTRYKKEQTAVRAKMRKKDESISFLQKEMARLSKEIERTAQREQNRAAKKDKHTPGTIQQRMEHLEDEIDHWKSVNMGLEDELAMWKAEANELKEKLNDANDDLDDDASMGDFSMHSQMSNLFNMSTHSLSSVAKEDLFFAPGSDHAPPISIEEPSTPSQRALRSVSTLWSKMTEKPPVGQANPAIPYTMTFDD